jgi:hypothetical protein
MEISYHSWIGSILVQDEEVTLLQSVDDWNQFSNGSNGKKQLDS